MMSRSYALRGRVRDHAAAFSVDTGGRYIKASPPAPVKMARYAPKRSRRRTLRRNKRRGNRRTFRPQNPLGAPNSIVRTLQTVVRCDINPAASSAITALVWALNGATDPTLATSSQQPLYFDQHMALYNQYCVLGWSIQIDAVSPDNTNAVVVGFTPKTDSTALTDPSYYIESKGTVYRLATADIDKLSFGSRGSVRKWLRPNGGSLINDVTYSGTAAANPTTILYAHIWAAAVAGASVDPSTINLIIKLRQIIRFYNVVTPPRS